MLRKLALAVFGRSKLDKEGREVPDSRPLVENVELRPLTMQEQIARLMRVELSRRAADTGQETFDEANDFDVPDAFDSPDPIAMYEQPMEEEFISREEIERRLDADNEAAALQAAKALAEKKQAEQRPETAPEGTQSV